MELQDLLLKDRRQLPGTDFLVMGKEGNEVDEERRKLFDGVVVLVFIVDELEDRAGWCGSAISFVRCGA